MPAANASTRSRLTSASERSGTGKYGDEPFERILLNGKPVYLRAALDQSFNPKGIYTAPDDDFFKRDMIIAKTMGLNGLRIHIKPDEPRRLYWADRIGVLILQDMPNTWRQNREARAAWEQTMREAVAPRPQSPRDHRRGSPSTRPGGWAGPRITRRIAIPRHGWPRWSRKSASSMVTTRLVEDNSPCNYDHIADTDLNSWHFYIDNHERGAAPHRRRGRQDQPRQRFQLLPGPDPVERFP